MYPFQMNNYAAPKFWLIKGTTWAKVVAGDQTSLVLQRKQNAWWMIVLTMCICA